MSATIACTRSCCEICHIGGPCCDCATLVQFARLFRMNKAERLRHQAFLARRLAEDAIAPGAAEGFEKIARDLEAEADALEMEAQGEKRPDAKG